MVVVFNSSPWIFLSKLEFIESAIELFRKVYIPSSVNTEVFRRRDEASSALEKLRKEGRVEIVGARSSRLVKALGRRLGKGEAEAIAVALERDADLIVLDDHTARIEASRIGLRIKGTLGIIRRLIELDKFKGDLSELYEHLSKMGFRVKENLFWEIFNWENR